MHAATPARRLRIVLVGTVASLALLAWAGGAGALSMEPNPLDLTGEGLEGEVELVEVTSGNPGTLLDGSPDDVTLVFRASLHAGSASLDEIITSVLDTEPLFSCCDATGLGHYPDDPGEAVTGGSLASGDAIFGFDSLDPGETTQRFFVFYASGLLETDQSQQARFSPRNQSTQQSFTASATLVPEPATVALVGLGLGGLAWASRSRRAG